ncbi:hypothetical protein FW778_00530 [Ginsengibacter hankyongi]|uniref:Uncharacterized protein n=1 Tax=Ginsengibacter hankyongi TaxID=2607284 RepID=A0A5J5IHL8_9BACT|nr:phage integrase SAM-like domain and Arm DNA-binding domain-containing protein [Ginsengibacter hankyongi]KAA9040565.1 hypothetical protein FW778_00530 [Ginsengibacter hankyongi]
MPIYMRSTVNGLVKELATSRKSDPELWDQKSEKAYGKGEYIKELNNHLSTLKVKIFEARAGAYRDKQTGYSKTSFSVLLKNQKTILEVFKKHNEQLAALVDSEYSPATLRRYKISFGHILSFIKWKYDLEDFEINKLNYDFLTDYVFWLKSVRKCNHNTTMKYTCNFRKIVNGCIRHGWLTRDPFWGFKMSTQNNAGE